MFDSELQTLIAKHAMQGVLVDSNLLLVLCVGNVDPALLKQEKRTKQYIPADFQVLQTFLSKFQRVLTTPNIVTEVSNLSRHLRSHVTAQVAGLINRLLNERIGEHYVQSAVACENYLYEKLGLADAAIGVLAEQGMLVLTNDLNLTLLLESRQFDCVHYDRTLRQIALDLK